MDATRVEVERELEEMYCRLKGVRLQITRRRDSIAKDVQGRKAPALHIFCDAIAKDVQGRGFSADNFADALHCLKLDEEEERQYSYTIKVLQRILERTEEPAVKSGE